MASTDNENKKTLKDKTIITNAFLFEASSNKPITNEIIVENNDIVISKINIEPKKEKLNSMVKKAGKKKISKEEREEINAEIARILGG